jgi:hypothetical protein
MLAQAADNFFASQAMLLIVVALVSLAACALGWLLLGTAARRTATWPRGWRRSGARSRSRSPPR